MIVKCFGLVTVLLALIFGAGVARAETHIAPRLVAESAAPAAGSTVTLALAMTPAAGWHGYWKNPGDAGVEPRLDWTLPAGVEAGPMRYPVPHRLIISGLMNYVYEGPYAKLIALRIPAGMAPGTRLPLRAKASWLACTDQICVPESADLALDLIVGEGAVDPATQARFDRWRMALPKPVAEQGHFARGDGVLRLAVPLAATVQPDQPYFFSLTDGAIDYAAPQAVTRNGDRLIIAVKAGSAERLDRVEGVLRIGDGDGLAVTAVPGEVPDAGVALGGGGAVAILTALAGAIAGGLLLNIMPCVFPILSLKALSLARKGESEAAARREAVSYAAGAILACLALGGALLALRAGGVAAGWAFQLQEPRVILLLLLLVTAIALNLAGLFELPALAAGEGLAAKGGAGGAFWTGALAAFVATPCTGPFMAAALGAALVLPTLAALAVFAGLGLGLALPFLLIGFVPALRRRLPRPGAWMAGFRRLLSLPMFLTALAFAWILGRQSGVDGMTLGLIATTLVALALWWVGRRQAGGARRAWWPVLPAALASLAVLAVVPREPAEASAAAAPLGAEPFSEARLAALRASNAPVFVYFTADWCVTCKVNEKTALANGEVAKSFREKGIKVLVGDWTRGDPAIGRFLAAQGRSGVPLYLFYRPGKAAEVLPQILTPGPLAALGG